MRCRRWSVALGALALALLVAGPAAADGQRKPKGQSSSPSKAQARSSGSARSSSTPRIAVPRSDSGSQQRQPKAEARRVPGGGSGGHRGHYPVYQGPYSYHPWGWWGWWGWWGGWAGPYYYPGGYYPAPGVYYYPDRLSPTMGALDLDLRPEDTEVWLNGTLIGVADNFDGWPRYLWLEEGTYDLVFFLPGFETIARQYSIYPGVVIDVEDRMQRGESTRPEDLVSQSTERRDERLERRAERGEDTGEGAEPAWRERVREEREAMEDEPYVDARVEPARLHLTIEPSDAAIYLDGRFVGSAEELVAVHAGLIVDPGEHELEAVRPGYASKTTTFTAEAGEEVELTLELEAAP